MHSFGGGGLPDEGVLLGQAARTLLDLREGDEVELVVPRAGTSITSRVTGFVDEPLGTYAYTSLGNVERAAAQLGTPPSTLPSGMALVQYHEGADRATMRARLGNLPAVTVVQDTHSLVDAVESLLGLIYTLVGMMLLFGTVLAVALVYNTMSTNVAERSVEIATLEANGAPTRTLARMVTAENLLVAALAIAPGLMAGWFVAGRFISSFSDDQFNFTLQLRTATPFAVAAGVLAVAWLAQLPSLRALRRLDIARIVRERSV